jgi:hypothetical protein
MAAMAHRLVQGVDQGCASPAMVLDAMVHGEASAKLAKALASSLGSTTVPVRKGLGPVAGKTQLVC